MKLDLGLLWRTLRNNVRWSTYQRQEDWLEQNRAWNAAGALGGRFEALTGQFGFRILIREAIDREIEA